MDDTLEDFLALQAEMQQEEMMPFDHIDEPEYYAEVEETKNNANSSLVPSSSGVNQEQKNGPSKNLAQEMLNKQFSSNQPIKAKKLSTDEFARSIKAERELALGKEGSKQQPSLLFDKCSKLSVMHENLFPIEDENMKKTNLAVETYLKNVIDEKSIYCTLSNGKRVFFKDRQDIIDPEKIQSRSSNKYMKQLLSRPIQDIMEESQELVIEKLHKGIAEDSEEAKSNKRVRMEVNDNYYDDEEAEEDIEMDAYEDKKLKSREESSLWVDKYSPKTFTQLLSLEKTNREVLKAVKRWDKFVFKKDNKLFDHNYNHHSHNNSNNNNNQNIQEEFDLDGRPKKKVILLCGPPGTGKTTLAHVVAQHCGYRPIEINASDDRSPEYIRELLSRATQNTTLSHDKRPNCIIIDEIDGLDNTNKQSLDLLIEILNAPIQSHSKETNSGTSKKSSSATNNNNKKDIFPLTRPLICICNDQYAPVLRDLKKISDIFLFQLPQDLRLVSRLQQICKEENIIIPSTSVLNELIVATGHDIRSSINNLQFAALHLQQQQSKGKKNNHQKISSINKEEELKKKKHIENIIENMMRVGLKDDHLDAYQIWNQIFTKRIQDSSSSSTSHQYQNNHPFASPSSSSSTTANIIIPNSEDGGNRIDNLSTQGIIQAMDAMLDHGDSSLIISGIYENMHRIYSYDIHNINRHSFSTEWLSWTNLFASSSLLLPNSLISSSYFDVLSQYSALLGSAVYYSHAISSKPKLEWPKKDKEQAYFHNQREHILQSLTENSYNIFNTISKERIVMDVISSLIDIIRPRIRPIPLISMSKDEQKIFYEVIEIMESCELHYQPTVMNNFPTNTTTTNQFQGKFNQKKPWQQQQKGPNPQHNADYNVLLSDRVVLLLDPDIELLITYHVPIGPANNNNNNNNNFNNNRNRTTEKIQNHSFIAADLKHMIYMEQRKYSIRKKEERISSEEHSHHHHHSQQQLQKTPLSSAKKAPLPSLPSAEGEAGTAMEVTESTPAKSQNGLFSSPAAAIPPTEAEEEKKDTTTEPPATKLDLFSNAKPISHGLSAFLIKRPKEESANQPNKKAKTSTSSVATSNSNQPGTAQQGGASGVGNGSGVGSSTASSAAAQPAQPMGKDRIHYKFNEGYSNAVKRTVFIKDFL